MRISFTYSRYIFWDLLRIFLMASGALAGIMSFGGLLRPLTQQGLDAGQVAQLLACFTPAMTAYSFPIAALFATTMVYGRLSADNELTAWRAAGINLMSVAAPAFVFGAVVATTCLVFLSFVVPAFTLKAEKVLYSNIAKLVAGRIQRDHQISIPGSQYTIFAEDAYLPPPTSMKRGEQQVVLTAPMILKFKRPFGRDDWQYKVPEEFWTASSATAYVEDAGDNANPRITVVFRDGMNFPRQLKREKTAAVGASQFGPVPIQSAVKENTKFMDLRELYRLRTRQEESRKIQGVLGEFIYHDQEREYLTEVRTGLGTARRFAFQTLQRDEYVLSFGEGVSAAESGGEVVVAAVDLPVRQTPSTSMKGGDRPVRLSRKTDGAVKGSWTAREARIRVWPRRGSGSIDVSLTLADSLASSAADAPATNQLGVGQRPGASLRAADVAAGTTRAILPITFHVPMPEPVAKLGSRGLAYYVSPAAAESGNQPRLMHELVKLKNDLVSEMHGRVALAASCLILVLVGCALGMMFRSGNFLTSFAISFVPALLAITLILAGQQTCGNVPWQRGANPIDRLNTGIAIIWSGSLVNLLVSVALLRRLARV